MNKTFKTILGMILAWALAVQLGASAVAQSPTITTLQSAATATGNGTPLIINGAAGNPANTLGAVGVQIANAAGTFTVTFETLTSGSTWTAVMATNMTDDVRATTASAAGQYTILMGSAIQFRARISACSSCNVTVTGRLVPGLVSRAVSGGGGGGGSGGITVGTTTVTSGSAGRLLYETAGNVVGEISGATSNGTNVTFGSGNLIAMDAALTTTATLTRTAVGVTSADGLIVTNTTAAAAGAQQYSPRLRFTGSGWKTNATAASQTVDWIVENQPVQGAANPTTNLVFASQVNAGGYTNRAFFTGSGYLAVTDSANGGIPNLHTLSDATYGLAILPSATRVSVVIASGEAFRVSSTVDSLSRNIGASNGGQLVIGSGGSFDSGFARSASAVIRVTNSSTGAGSLVLGTSTVGSIGTSGVGVLAIANGTAPSSSPADEFQLYSADSTAGDANAFIRNELGEVNRISGLSAINTSAFAKTTDTTLANITGLTRNVEAGRTYAFRAVMQTTAAATGGVKFAVSGTATATSINYEGVLTGGLAIVAQTRGTALGTVVCASTTTTAGTCTVEGVIVVNAAGTLTLQFAQNNSDGGASTVLINQYMQLIPIS